MKQVNEWIVFPQGKPANLKIKNVLNERFTYYLTLLLVFPEDESC